MKISIIRSSFFLIAISIGIASCTSSKSKADLIVTNATIWTGDSSKPAAEAMAIAGDTILAIGSFEEVGIYKTSTTEMVDALEGFITPGFIDAHVHLIDGGFNLSSVKLRDSKSPKDFINRIAKYVASVPPGTWITGGEWDGSEWETPPSKEWIDSISTEHPVFVTGLSGHIALANSLAMKQAGLTPNVDEVEGGVIGRSEFQELTGIFKDNAMTLISDKIPQATNEQIDNALEAAMKHFTSNGITTVHNVWYPTDSKGHNEAFLRAYKNNKLFLRIFTFGELEQWRAVSENANSLEKNKWLNMNGVKGVFDGALGSHTAAFFEPFSDDPTDSGLFMMPEKKLYEWVSKADSAKLQVAIHAIGDRAISTLLDTYEKIQLENGARDRRFRVEHAQHLSPLDIERFDELDVIPSMQPYHAIDDGRWAEKAIGPERIKTTYAFKSLLDADAKVAFGSDWSVAPVSPLWGIYAAVTRRTLDEKNPDGWVPKQKITVEEALRAYTSHGAYASFEEDIKGVLAPGMLADFVILNENLLNIDPVKIKDVKVMQTYVGGNKVYDRSAKSIR